MPDEPDRRAIAFMPGVHFPDIFADFDDIEFDGLPTIFEGEEKPRGLMNHELNDR